jgi:hypothetical protein
MKSPYKPGATLQLQLPDHINLFVTIEHVFELFTMAVVLRVSFQSEPPTRFGLHQGDVAVLKLYDRRFAEDLHQRHRASPYIPALQTAMSTT